MLNLSDYDFSLPPELIAQQPSEKRGNSRLLVIHRQTGQISHRKFADIVDYFNRNDCLVINVTKVIPARIFGKKESGGKVELLIIKSIKDMMTGSVWTALLKPSVASGKNIIFENGISAKVADRKDTGEYVLEFNKSAQAIDEFINKSGIMPLPPYIKRKNQQEQILKRDAERYQTIYAREKGSIAAPTAGLHFTEEILTEIKKIGVEVVELILHIGIGTFRKIYTQDIQKHKMLPEWYQLTEPAAKTINERKKNGGRIFAVGTTVVRTLETLADEKGFVRPQEGETSLFIYPGYKFKTVDCLLTNLHLPKSTPLLLASAFCSREILLKAYAEAIQHKYRFFSYGDATLII